MHESADRRNRKIQYRAGLEAVEESKHQHEKERAEGGRGDDRAQDQSQKRGDDDHEQADRDARRGRELPRRPVLGEGLDRVDDHERAGHDAERRVVAVAAAREASTDHNDPALKLGKRRTWVPGAARRAGRTSTSWVSPPPAASGSLHDRTQPDHTGLPRDAVDHALAHVVTFDPDGAIKRQGVERPLPPAVGTLTIIGRKGGEASGHPLERRVLAARRRSIIACRAIIAAARCMEGTRLGRAVARLGEELPAPHFAVAVALE